MAAIAAGATARPSAKATDPAATQAAILRRLRWVVRDEIIVSNDPSLVVTVWLPLPELRPGSLDDEGNEDT
jgi:hypothetical protein